MPNDFFQTVRLLEAAGHQEKIFFRALPSLAFPVSAIGNITHTPKSIDVQVSFMGLTGPAGVLPDHYTELLLQRLHIKDTTLRDFLDLFNHRLITLFYQAWAKYRYYVNPEHVTQLLLSLVGSGTQKLQQRLSVPDESLLFYAGLFAQQTRSAANLAAILSDYFSVAVTIIPFQGKWLAIDQKDRSQMGSRKSNYHQLGRTAVLGQRIWDMQNNFRIQIRELWYERFKQFLPGSHKLQALIEMARRYIGIELNFDIQLVLQANEVPRCQLKNQDALVLGWNAWLKARPFVNNVGDTVLRGIIEE